MPGIYLSLVFCLFFGVAHTQDFKKEQVAFADEQRAAKNYISAIRYYKMALATDSTDLSVWWKYAECLRLYRDYREAERVYAKIYELDKRNDYIRSIYYLGQMQKHNGKYSEALETFKEAKKKYLNDKRGYLYQKSKQEIESCLWAKRAMLDTVKVEMQFLPQPINSSDSEFGHTIWENTLYFSSMKGDSTNQQDEIFAEHYTNSIYTAKLTDSVVNRQTDVFSAKRFSGNGSFSLDKKRFYYSSCVPFEDAFQCKILVARVDDDRLFGIDTLGEIINEEDANTTMPFVGLFKGKETLFFASDRRGGKGGLDLYYAHIKNGTQYAEPVALSDVNTMDEDICPFFDSLEQKLYFSSNWYYGFGGFDIYSAQMDKDQFDEAKNLGLPINSSANDLYYFRDKEKHYLSTNRMGVLYSNNPTCCSDILSYSIPVEPELVDTLIAAVNDDTLRKGKTPRFTSLQDLNKKLPIALYFHNDIPNPRSLDTTSKVNYINSYTDYMAMIPEYKREYSKGLENPKATEAQEDIESFFTEFVEQGVKDLLEFQELLLAELQRGNSIVLTVKGFASPLAKTNYNVNLTKRRIASLVNYLAQLGSGEFAPYLNGTAPNGAKLKIQQVPFGEYTAAKLISDNPNDLKNSIYSRAASLERKIEIQSVTFLKQDSVNHLIATQQVADLGKIDPNQIYKRKYTVTNDSKEPLTISKIDVPCHCNTATIGKKILQPGESTEVEMTFDPKGYTGQVVKSVYLHVEGTVEPLRLVMTGEMK